MTTRAQVEAWVARVDEVREGWEWDSPDRDTTDLVENAVPAMAAMLDRAAAIIVRAGGDVGEPCAWCGDTRGHRADCELAIYLVDWNEKEVTL